MGPQDRQLKALFAFLREAGSRKFEFGVWDCLIFTNEAFRRMHGEGWAEDWVGRYMGQDRPMTRAGLRREYGFKTLEDALCARLTRASKVPPRGALVVGAADVLGASYIGVSFGISVGTSAAFLSDSGVVYLPIEQIDSAWVRNDAA